MSSHAKKIGLLLPHWENGYEKGTPRSVDVVESARVAERCGLDSVWLVDHFLSEPYLDEAAHWDVPESWKGLTIGFWECWTLASAIATATERVQIGTLVSNTGYRNPALLAQMMNTIDDLSEGRLIAGLGAGDFPAEHKRFGYTYERRVGRFEEALQIISPLLRGETARFEGEFYRTDGAELRPKGPSPNGPPILIGVLLGGPRMNRLVSQYASEWNCWIAENSKVEVYLEARDAMVQACEKHARDPSTLRKNATIRVGLPGFQPESPVEECIQGSLDEIADELGRFLKEDVDHLSVSLRPFSTESIETFAEIVKRVR